ncbi:MAG: hypothetical protein NXH84_09625 [Rhodobacteraceae bacterium]|nr:hypothetical protein [Paracoccaceae bacterium]
MSDTTSPARQPKSLHLLTLLNKGLNRSKNASRMMILAVGHAAENVTVPAAAKVRKPLDEIMTVHRNGRNRKE